MQPYGPLEKLGPGAWARTGEWYETSLRRRMTVMALASGELVVHNPFVLDEAGLAELKSLGKVTAIVMPNAFHGDEVKWMADHWPEARVFVPGALRTKLQKVHRVDGTLEQDWPQAWTADVLCLPINGLRLLHESVFLHRTSRTLVVTDLVFNMKSEDFKSAIERKIMAWNRVGLGLAPSWLCDNLFTRDASARRQSIDTILSWDFDRVIMSHGQIVGSGGKELMRAAFA